MNCINRAKCQGCAALIITKTETKYKCALGVGIKAEEVEGVLIRPAPMDKCYKPTTDAEVKEAKELIKNKANAKKPGDTYNANRSDKDNEAVRPRRRTGSGTTDNSRKAVRNKG